MSLVDLGKRLLDAAKSGDTENVRTLMSNGAPFTTDWLGTSPLHFSAQFGHVATAEALLRAGISRDARTKVDRTPLHVACQEGHLDIVDLLIRSGADIEAKDMLKMTPLHWAVEKAHINVIQALIKQAADVTCENKFDKTPIEITISNGRSDIAQLLQMANSIVEVTTEGTVEEVAADNIITAVHDDSQQQVILSGSPVTIVPSTAETVTVSSSASTSQAAGVDADQSSTSVLATLAALAEATAPFNASSATNTTTAADALNWLETHGITMISSSEAPSMVTSSLESGQILTLTEAGKLALNSVKSDPDEEDIEEGVEIQEVTEVQEIPVHEMQETIIEENVDSDDEQKVITIVSDQTNADGSVMVTVGEQDSQDDEDDGSGEPSNKRPRLTETIIISGDPSNQEELRRQLEQVQKEAEEYKLQLKQKEQEAEEYKKQLSIKE